MVMESVRTQFETQAEIQKVEEKPRTSREVLLERSGIQKALVETLTKVAKEGQGDSKFDIAKDVLDVGVANAIALQERLDRRQNSSSSYETEKEWITRGVLAETCATITMEKLGFKIIDATVEEDLDHGLDMYVIAPEKYGSGQIWAVQIKSYANADNVAVRDLKKQEVDINFIENSGAIINKNPEDSYAALKSYVANKSNNPYTTHPEFVDEYWVRPVAIIIPSGRENGVFKRNGEPTSNFPAQLLKEIERVFPPKKTPVAHTAQENQETPVRA